MSDLVSVKNISPGLRVTLTLDGTDHKLAVLEGVTESEFLGSDSLVLSRSDGGTPDQGTGIADDDGDAAASDDGSSMPEDSSGSEGGTLEAGQITVFQENASEWHSVSFAQNIEDARVVMGPLSFNGSEPATVRVRNVSEQGFEFQIDEWEYLDGFHLTETVSWLAMSEGTHT